MIFQVVASAQSPADLGPDTQFEVEESCDPAEVTEQVLRFTQRGYWAAVFSQRSGSLLAGPFNPNAIPAAVLS